MTPQRCAIYTRKSSEEGLEQGFNSLQAQREACEAYVLSQAGEGWKVVPGLYDDGGFSGGNTERPGLKALLADITAGLVDIVVVYKVDRLTRSLHDFSRIVERFDAKGVSFVSVTQAFNTTSSMGRLTLNMLLSFAQFEREVTGERIRDKIAASKAKGMWMGGRPPLGYDGKERKLVVNEAEAKRVRAIFHRYLELGTVVALTRDLRRRDERGRPPASKTGVQAPGAYFTRGSLRYLLENPVYRGAIRHRALLYPNAHPAIIDEDLWDAVQARLAAQEKQQPAIRKQGEDALLKGLLTDDLGGTMSPVHTSRHGRRYHYYVSAALVHGEDGPTGSLPRIGAPVLDAFVAERVSAELSAAWAPALPKRERVRSALVGITLGEALVRIRIKAAAIGSADAQDLDIAVAIRLKHRQRATLIAADDQAPIERSTPDRPLIRAVSLARVWRARLESGEVANVRELARRERLCPRHASRLLPLAYLAPDLVQVILDGRQPPAMSLQAFTARPLPRRWEDQRRLVASFR